MSTLKIDRQIPHAIAHEFSDGGLLLSRGYDIFRTDDVLNGGLVSLGALPVRPSAHRRVRIRSLARALRLGCSSVKATREGTILAVGDRCIFRKGVQDEGFIAVQTIERGSRPLHRGLCITRSNHIYWGEYFDNP